MMKWDKNSSMVPSLFDLLLGEGKSSLMLVGLGWGVTCKKFVCTIEIRNFNIVTIEKWYS
jgi:hypothetical protein